MHVHSGDIPLSSSWMSKNYNDRWTTRGSASCSRHSYDFYSPREDCRVAMLSGASRSCTRTFNFLLDWRRTGNGGIWWEKVANTHRKRAIHGWSGNWSLNSRNQRATGLRQGEKMVDRWLSREKSGNLE